MLILLQITSKGGIMKTAYDRGYQKGLESFAYKGCTPPEHYHKWERAQWLKGWCEAYLSEWHGYERSEGNNFIKVVIHENDYTR